ncbi:RmlC-like cupin [Peniophora sp. CONT]|nr:RmlC-like cupin [Peniophora sp. CONT]
MLSLASLGILFIAGVTSAAPIVPAVTVQDNDAGAGAAFASQTAKKVAALRAAPTYLDRLKLLEDKDFVFDFKNPPTTDGVTRGAGGTTVNGIPSNFPAITGTGVSMTVGFLNPCAINSPHVHPRASEINFSVNTTLQTGFLLENGDAFHLVDIPAGSAVAIPQGAIHFEMNPSCEAAMFVAGFNNEDPGVTSIAQRFFGLPSSVVGAALGGLGVVVVAEMSYLIPDNVIQGVDECLARCGLKPTKQTTFEQQPRISANAYPEGALESATAALAAAGTGIATALIKQTAATATADRFSSAIPTAASMSGWKRETYPQPTVFAAF